MLAGLWPASAVLLGNCVNWPLALAGHPGEQTTYFGLGESPVATRRTDTVDPPRRGPTGDSLWINPKDRGDLAGRHQTVLCVHPIPQHVGQVRQHRM